MSRPTTGDKVRIISLPGSLDNRLDLLGKIGEIIRDDHAVQPYRIRVNDDSLWFYEHNVELVEEAPAPQKPKRELKPGDKVRVKSRGYCETIVSFVRSMIPFCDRIVTIAYQRNSTFYRIVEDGQEWNWDINAFDLEEPPQKPKSKPTDKIISLFSGGNKPVFKEKLPLIKTNKLLTNIKLD